MSNTKFDLDASIALLQKLRETGDVNLIEDPQLRAAVAANLAAERAAALRDAPETGPRDEYRPMRLGPNVLELLRFVLKAAKVSGVEWRRWYSEAEAADEAAREARSAQPAAPANKRPNHLRLVGRRP